MASAFDSGPGLTSPNLNGLPSSRSPLSRTADPTVPRRAPGSKIPPGMQPQTGKGSLKQEDFMNGMERDFKSKHLGLMGVFGWIL